MRRIIMFNQVTADGYFAQPDGGLGWVRPDPEMDARTGERLGDADTILFGRRTYEMFESFWPHALDDSPTSPDPHGPDHRSEGIRAVAEWINGAEKVVFSRTRAEVDWHNSRLVRELDPSAIEAMKRGPGRDMMLFGSGSIVSLLSAHGLIDEYQFVVGPALIGAGRTLMDGAALDVPLELLEATAFRSGNVLLRYARRG